MSDRNPMDAESLRRQIVDLVERYVRMALAPQSFEPGETAIPASGAVIGAPEIRSMVETALDGWLTIDKVNRAFERDFAEFLSVPHVLTCNSGSSATLLAVAALTAPELGEGALKPGDEVITAAAAFPTTVNPLLLHGLVPVFVDVDIPTYNMDASLVEAALGPRTRAILATHTLGNPVHLDEITRIAEIRDLWFIEDSCDALGSTYRGRQVGSFGDLATFSFYPAHHITMGEGGAVATRAEGLAQLVESFRDWGRDCHCLPGHDDTCGRRFSLQFPGLPTGYDHKYVFTHMGFNLKITEIQAACGLAQLERLPGFVAARKRNFALLRERLAGLEEWLILPEATAESDPAWFGFPLTLREGTGLSRLELVTFLERNRIATRLLFGGNLIKQPYFARVAYRRVGELSNTDRVMADTFWLGLHPAIGEQQIDYMGGKLEEYLRAPASRS